jgi:hypothetical protein
MTALGELICSLNPYTELLQDPVTGLSTGQMDVELLEPAKPPPEEGDSTVKQSDDDIIGKIEIEIEENYGTKWTFKGQTQSVKTAVRIPYRFPVFKCNKLVYWRIEYLLIGYAGADGGG